jgi:hypothetical protein
MRSLLQPPVLRAEIWTPAGIILGCRVTLSYLALTFFRWQVCSLHRGRQRSAVLEHCSLLGMLFRWLATISYSIAEFSEISIRSTTYFASG